MSDASHAISRRSFLALQGLLLAATLPGCGAPNDSERAVTTDGPRTLDEIRSSGFVNIGICSDNAPLAFINAKGVYDGLDQYLALHLAAQLRVEPRYVSLDPRERYDALLDGAVDISLVQMSPSDERAAEVALSAPFYKISLGIVSPKGAVVEDPEQLAGGELIVCEGTYAQHYAATAWPDIPLRVYGTLSETYAALADGHGSSLIADEISIAAWMRRTPGFVLGMKALDEPRLIAPAIADGQEELLAVVDEAVGTFISYGYRARANTSDVVPRVGDGYASMFEGITA